MLRPHPALRVKLLRDGKRCERRAMEAEEDGARARRTAPKAAWRWRAAYLTSSSLTIASAISWCAWCASAAPAGRYCLNARSRGGLTLQELAPRMRCSRCGKKAAEVVRVSATPHERAHLGAGGSHRLLPPCYHSAPNRPQP